VTALATRTKKEDRIMKQNKASQAAGIAALIAGFKKHYPTGSTTLQVGGASYTVDSLTTTLQGAVDQESAVEAAKTAYSAKLQAQRAQAPSNNALIKALKAYVRSTFGSSADTLADFGLSPPKARTPQSAAAKAVSVAKRAATRTARGTKGTVQKLAIKGNVSASLVVSPAPGPTPAAAPPAAPSTATAPSSAPAAQPATTPASPAAPSHT
jgi:hypothetical protein